MQKQKKIDKDIEEKASREKKHPAQCRPAVPASEPGPKRQLEECQKLAQEYLAGWQRAKADFENYKKEEAKRTGEVIGFAKAGWLLELLRIFDNFERIEQHTPDTLKDNEWAKGVSLVKSQLADFLKAEGVEEIRAAGEKFNPQLHEAVEQLENRNKEAGRVIEVLEKGYLLNGRVLRPSKVKVAK